MPPLLVWQGLCSLSCVLPTNSGVCPHCAFHSGVKALCVPFPVGWFGFVFLRQGLIHLFLNFILLLVRYAFLCVCLCVGMYTGACGILRAWIPLELELRWFVQPPSPGPLQEQHSLLLTKVTSLVLDSAFCFIPWFISVIIWVCLFVLTRNIYIYIPGSQILNSQYLCLSLLSAEITDVHHHTQLGWHLKHLVVSQMCDTCNLSTV